MCDPRHLSSSAAEIAGSIGWSVVTVHVLHSAVGEEKAVAFEHCGVAVVVSAVLSIRTGEILPPHPPSSNGRQPEDAHRHQFSEPAAQTGIGCPSTTAAGSSRLAQVVPRPGIPGQQRGPGRV